MAIKTYKDGTPFTGIIGRATEESSPAWPEPPRPPEGAPNVIFFVLDDIGYGQLSSFGGLVETPVLDRLSNDGLRYTNMQAVKGHDESALRMKSEKIEEMADVQELFNTMTPMRTDYLTTAIGRLVRIRSVIMDTA